LGSGPRLGLEKVNESESSEGSVTPKEVSRTALDREIMTVSGKGDTPTFFARG